MRRSRLFLFYPVVIATHWLVAHSLHPAAHAQARDRGEIHGRFSLLSYNVAGLPDPISESTPSRNVRWIAHLLNRYSIALLQEDFAYQKRLRSGVRLPYGSSGSGTGRLFDLGDGLARFAREPFSAVLRNAWRKCSGVFWEQSDCVARKGFTFARHALGEGTTVDIYDIHLDAGDSSRDREARAAQIRQLAEAIRQRSDGQPVIVAGDTNIAPRETAELEWFLRAAGLRDACVERSSSGCGIDRVFYRSSSTLSLEPLSWRVDRNFVDAAGRPLSDHPAVAVDFRWSAPALSRLTARR